MSGSSARTVVQAIEDAAASTKTGYRFIDESAEGRDAEPFFTHGGIERASARYGGALQALGAKKGDRVALILPDNADFVFAFLGAIRAGLVPVPIYPPTGLGKLAGYLDNTLHIVAKSGARLLVTNGDIKRMLGTIQAQAPELSRVVAVEGVRSMREELKPAKVSLDDTCFLQFTSGSTSRPKGVVLTHANLAANVRAIMEQGLGIRDSVDTGASWLPAPPPRHGPHRLRDRAALPREHDHVPAAAALPQAARALAGDDLPPPRERVVRAELRVRALRQAHQGERDGGARSLELARRRLRRRAHPRGEPARVLQAASRAWGFSDKAFVCCYGMAESTLAISFSKLGTGVRVDVVDGAALWEKGQDGARGDISETGERPTRRSTRAPPRPSPRAERRSRITTSRSSTTTTRRASTRSASARSARSASAARA